MTRSTILRFTAVSLLLAPPIASADPAAPAWLATRARDPWHVCWIEPCGTQAAGVPAAVRIAIPSTLPAPASSVSDDPQAARRPVAIEYSEAYQTRRKIHKYASFATLPLLATELALGQSLYSNTPTDTSSRRGLHAALGTGIIALFGVNTVTGAWNLFGEGRKDPHGRTLRLVHGLLMMTADAGLVASSLSGPNSRHLRGALTYETDKATHRDIALVSMGTGTIGYLVMLFGNR